MARRLVMELWQRVYSTALPLSLSFSFCACSAFDPVAETRYTRLDASTFDDLGMTGAHWHAYDDQHSHTSPCTNGAAGNHEPSQCGHIDAPPLFLWDGGKCPPTKEQEEDLRTELKPENGRICLQGRLDGVLPCVDTDPTRCPNAKLDSSNMWGAAVALDFSDKGKQEWDAIGRGFTGIAFDLTILPADAALHLRVQLPVALGRDTPMPDRPLMRDDGSVIGATDWHVYSYDCESVPRQLVKHPKLESAPTLCDALVPPDASCPVTSNQHPLGSPFWALEEMVEDGSPSWDPSPVRPGHNEFSWDKVYAPLGLYPFERGKMLGIHFQVVHTTNETEMKSTSSFHFCIENLALLHK